ncbi:HNH endonuclease [Acidithiobacillus ferrivorans]|nr:HNH endonuclease [Acidithiobacillus ferrivorans]
MGMPFLFKLKRPNNHIAGGGFFVTYSTLPVPLAWEVFGEKNGAATLEDFRALLGPLTSDRRLDSDIGCTVLANPFFLSPERWIKPPGWATNIVRGKMYETSQEEGAVVWAAVAQNFDQGATRTIAAPGIREQEPKYGSAVLVSPRLGQASFRVLITDAYKRRCAITGESTLIALEAAHIIPYSREGTHDVRNGLLLRADFHRLFDVGLVSVTPDLRIKISPRIREAYFNGKAYYRMNDAPLAQIPDRPELRPDPDRLDWHYKNCFQA